MCARRHRAVAITHHFFGPDAEIRYRLEVPGAWEQLPRCQPGATAACLLGVDSVAVAVHLVQMPVLPPATF